MKKQLQRWIALLLCCSVAALAGCAAGTEQTMEEDGQGAQVVMGRYVEQQLPYPEAVVRRTFQQVEDRSFRIFGKDETLAWCVWASDDAGESWGRVEYPWLEELRDYEVNGAAFTAEGGVYLLYYSMAQADDFGGEGLPDADALHFAYGDLSGLRQIEHSIDERGFMGQLLLSDNGAVVLHFWGGASILDVETGAMGTVVEISEMPYQGVYTVFDNTFAISENDTMHLYDLQSGEKLPSIEYDTNLIARYNGSNIRDRRIAVESDHEAVYYCDPSGIYRKVTEGVLTEVLVDGQQSSFGRPSLDTDGLYCHDNGDLTVLCSDIYNAALYRYTYHPDIPQKPTQELRVYTLIDTLTVQEAIVGYQRENPDVYIQYVVGMPAGGEITAPDALRTLSTELLAADGPDVLVLDGMPIDTYMEKEILVDLRDIVEPRAASGELVSHVARTYRQEDGAYYAVPTRFLPLVMAGDNLDSVHDLPSLNAWMEERSGQPVRLPPEFVMERMYDAHSYRWIKEGAWDADAFAADLAEMGRFAGMIQVFEHEEDGAVQRQRGELTFLHGGDFLYGEDRFTFGRMHSVTAVGRNGIAIVLEANGNGQIKAFPDVDGGVFIPVSILGVNASSKKQELAADFVTFCLGAEVQGSELLDGLPVNMAALADCAVNPDKSGAMFEGRGRGTMCRTDLESGALAEEATFDWQWAGDEFMQPLIALVSSLQQPAVNNEVLKRIVFEETEGYFGGSRSYEETLAAVNQKVELYLLEKA